jgi:glycerate dehydrogenase
VILTNCEFSTKARRRLGAGTRGRYALVGHEEVSENTLKDVEILLIDIALDSGKLLLSKEEISKMPRLKFIQSTRAGVDSVDFSQIPQNVKVCGNVGAYSEPMAEHTLGMILYLAKDLGQRNYKLAGGIADYQNSLFLKGKTLGVIGAGGIGQAVARLARCFGMRTLGVNSSGKKAPHFDRTYKISRLESVLGESHVVVVALPLNLRTLHLINESSLALMKSDCILVNVGRGHVIEEQALYNHLKNHPEFKCGLDVWWNYPRQNEPFIQRYPFFELQNFLGTPHISGFVPEERQIALDHAINNLLRYLGGGKLQGLAKREDYAGLGELLKPKDNLMNAKPD